MRTPAPINEAARLKALRRYHILDTPREQRFDDTVWLAAQICEAPIALVSLVDQHRLWFKGRYGVELTETPREDSFCAHAVMNAPQMLIVPDASRDERFTSNPLVAGDAHIRFYAGAPLVSPEGHAVGTLCVLDSKPRQLTEVQKNALRVLSDQVMTQLELRRRLRELKQTSDELLETNKELEGFSHAISHDLRRPLRAMTSYAQILRTRHTGQLSPTGQELLGQIERSGQRTADMLEDFLRLLRLRNQPLHEADIDMRQLVQSVLRDLQAQAGDRPPGSIRLGPLPRAWGDPGLLRQVWVNLLSNALKFSRGSGRTTIEIVGKEEPGRLVYSVKDYGIGFEMKNAERLWTAFGRLHGDTIEGAGLGLSIVQRIIAQHKGQVWAEGAPGEGATFFFALPRVAEEPANLSERLVA